MPAPKDSTPLMRQYFEIKAKYRDTILLYRMGDFYETFDEDARTVHKVLGITLTKRSNGKASEVALAGFPYHALDSYLPKLIRAGFRVAVCEQMEDPKAAKGIVKRDVTEIVTPGTTLSEKILDQKTNNFLATVVTERRDDQTIFGLALADASTGEFFVGEFREKEFLDQLNLFIPAEMVVPFSLYENMRMLLDRIKHRSVLTRQEDWLFSFQYAHDVLMAHFKTHSLKGFGVQDFTVGLCAAGAGLHYLRETQRTDVSNVRHIGRLDDATYMTLDAVTLRNLEILQATADGYTHGGLFSVLDHTETAMGGRMLKQWVVRPLKHTENIRKRLDAVEELTAEHGARDKVRQTLSRIMDLERIIAKVCAGRVNPREIRALCESLKQIPELINNLSNFKSDAIRGAVQAIHILDQLTDHIDNALVDEPSVQIKDGQVIREGYNEELDVLRRMAFDGKSYIAGIQQRERERTGIASLKVQFNNVFGYYIEITHTHKDKVPPDYIRKQTMTNAERFITPELKEYEEKILTAEDKIIRIETELFDAIRKTVAQTAAEIQINAQRIAELDCYASLAEAAVQNKYVKPVVDDSAALIIKAGRHPVVERILPPDAPFVPNDLQMNEEEQIHLITGPNMAGKSCYLRQVGLIVLLAQVGSFVPAQSAEIGITDKIFTRVGASDNLLGGESTFLVEMNETANILNNATSRSLILLDEIGRGTSTFDGLSIAWAITEYLHQHPAIRPKTLFATHYHELIELEELLPRVKNYNMMVKKYDDKIVFVRKIVRGGSDHSYGIEVAKLAGLPASVITRAREVMGNLESHNISAHKDKSELAGTSGDQSTQAQFTLFEDGTGLRLKTVLENLDVNSLTPLDALNHLNKLKAILTEQP
ncbi:MAG TPA: DNA mismatch repair protein MutS [bacterium]|nr:DNA mismatch repair protein MutS [bacterium]HNE83124.1 DNA mismatch repair protein MutS [bacterium]HNH32916.1 DNA mismatch repair protein MutS [bacterium]